MTARRYLALHFPFLPIDRLRDRPDGALVVVEKQRGAVRLVASCPRALALGIMPGLTLADARAREPALAVVEHDAHADARWIERIADACDRWSPVVAIDLADGITIDITGCAHLWGGEGALADECVAWFEDGGMHVRHALASTASAAQALARFQRVPSASDTAALRKLPVAALRLDEEIARALRRAGLKTIGDLASRPRGPLAARFGVDTASLLAAMLGEEDDLIVARRAPPALVFERRLAEPIARTEDVLVVIRDLARDAAVALDRVGKGGRRFAARLFRSDGDIRDLSIETGLPTRDPAAIARLFDERVDALADPLDPGFGFDLVRLAVPAIEPLAPTQLLLEGGTLSEDALAALVDRLSVRLGRGRVRRFAPRDTHIPEQAVLALPAVDAATPAAWPTSEAGEPPTRPLHLFDPPQPISAVAEVPDGPPRRFRWRRTVHEVTRFEGPERIASEWWRRDDNGGLTRDYYRVEDARGRRFWLFRHGLYGSESPDPGWYLHGLFA